MRTSATGTRQGPATPGRRQAAFTLVEVLVVVALVGIVLAVAAVNLMPSDLQVARRDAAGVALEIEQARDAAWFGGLPTAITFDAGQLRKWRLAGNRWGEAPGSRALQSEVRILSLHVEGQPLAPGERLVFLPDGLGTPFRIALEVRGQPWAIEGDAAGSVKLAEARPGTGR